MEIKALSEWIFFGPAKLIALWPHAGIAITAVLIAIQAALNLRAGVNFDKSFFRKAPVFAGLLWLIFGFYEQQFQAVMVGPPSGNTHIAAPLFRLDLIVLTPILYLMTAFALWAVWRTLITNPVTLNPDLKP